MSVATREKPSEALYSVRTWDIDRQKYTKQVGMRNPSLRVPWQGLLRALRELRTLGYSCHRGPRVDGYRESDPFVLVQRV